VNNVRHSSATTEHYSPLEIVRAARKVMNGLDVDPASSDVANARIGAARYYTKETNGFTRAWGGRIWLNPPGGLCDVEGREVIRDTKTRPGCTQTGACGLPAGHTHHGVVSSAKAWWQRLADQWVKGNVECAVFMGFSIEILQTTQVDPRGLPTPFDFQLCFPRQRVRFWVEKGGELTPGNSPTHSSVIVYLPPRWSSGVTFREEFSQFGRVIG